MDLQGPLISPLCPRSSSSELINNPLKEPSDVFGNSSDDHDESRSENTSNNRDSKTSDNLMPLLELEDSGELEENEVKTNSYENLCVANDLQAAVPLLEDNDDEDMCINNDSVSTQADFSRSSNTSLPRSQNSRSISHDEDHSKSSNISLPRSISSHDHRQRDYLISSNIALPGSEQTSRENINNLQKDFVNSSNVSLPGSGKSLLGSRQDLKNKAAKSLLKDQHGDENLSTTFAGTGRGADGGNPSVQTDV